MKKLSLFFALLLAGCSVAVSPTPVRVYAPSPPPVYVEPPPQPVVSVYVEPPIGQPAPIKCRWAPPPMLVETPPLPPFPDAVWIGGYWTWEGEWVWAHGRWAGPPRPGFRWRHPYYENRNGMVVFVNGFWSPPHVEFVPPPININITIADVRPGVVPGPPPIGPSGVFVPPPPGSRRGIIIPAPIGTPPAVVTSAPPVVNVGMKIVHNTNSNNTNIHNTNIRNTNINSNNTNINSNNTTMNKTTVVNNITNVTNVTIVAPANATATGIAVNKAVPAQAHLAAALPAVVKASAPVPTSTKPVPAFVPGRGLAQLPPPQVVHPVVPPTLKQRQAAAKPVQMNSHGNPNTAAQPTPLKPSAQPGSHQGPLSPSSSLSHENQGISKTDKQQGPRTMQHPQPGTQPPPNGIQPVSKAEKQQITKRVQPAPGTMTSQKKNQPLPQTGKQPHMRPIQPAPGAVKQPPQKDNKPPKAEKQQHPKQEQVPQKQENKKDHLEER